MTKEWFEWAKELQALSQTGLHYTKDVYDEERFQRIREISWQMLASLNESNFDDIKALFHNESGYQTPKVDTRAVVWRDDRILLVQENDERWALPGGWMDITETVSTNAEKELFEEAGVVGKAQRVIAIHDHHRHNAVNHVFTIIKIFMECSYISGDYLPNNETIGMAYFEIDQLPTLNEGKTSYEQIQMCWKAHSNDSFEIEFD
ncbi:NUDIX hydrolase N-terminal domain-containing protein [Aerococcaceae bacterium DSM 111021]|nr:NUDIX hydrolase N-terminal domain-containing protein [Aerococcaceae bacterium DSM 111021]